MKLLVPALVALLAGCATLGVGRAPSGGAAGQEDSKSPGVRPYQEVVTAEAVSDSGLFLVHRIGERVLYEVPPAELGRPLLWVATIARAQTGTAYGGQTLRGRVVHWERRGSRVLLRNEMHEIVADTAQPIYRAVEASRFAPVIMSFSVEAFGPDSAPVIDVTKLFTTDVAEFSPRQRLRAKKLDESRSLVERTVSFPRNIETEAMLTFEAEPDSVPVEGGGLNRPVLGTVSVVMHHSMVKLPEDPMESRLWDSRVGFFSIEQIDYGREEHRAEHRRFITRWRLEKKDPQAPLSEPVQPIVFYVDPATPKKWVPWLIRGVESWNAAFEKAGFVNAVQAREAPSPEEDPDWSMEDARISSIRWLPSTIENASGPHVHDPRTGEILEADIQWYHNVLNLLRNWYFVQVSPLDERARDLPLPDSLMGRLVEYVAAHEVGHTLGFPHNMKASSSYPIDSLRSAAFTARFADEPSIMDYGRFNYVAQPGDRASLVPVVGPYDLHAVEWGYTPIDGGPDDEREELDRLARRAEEDPRLRFGDPSRVDPTAQTEDLGDDAVAATRLGLANIRRIVPTLIAAAGEPGRDYSDLREIYHELIDQWSREMGHVAAVVGGVVETRRHYGTEGVVHHPLPRERQKRAVAFLAEEAFRTPVYLVDEEVLRRIQPAGAMERIGGAQRRVLEAVLDNDRMVRLVELEARAIPGERAYPLPEMLADVRAGIWTELDDRRVSIDAWRRNLQRHWLDVIDGKLNPGPGGPAPPGPPAPPPVDVELTDIRPLLRGELSAVRAASLAAIPRAADRVTRLHLEDVVFRVEQILDPRGRS